MCNHPMGPVGRAPPTLGITSRTKCIWSPPTFSTDCHFFLCRHSVKLSASPDFLAKFKRRMKEERREVNGWNMGRATTEDGKGTDKEKRGLISTPRREARPTFQHAHMPVTDCSWPSGRRHQTNNDRCFILFKLYFSCEVVFLFLGVDWWINRTRRNEQTDRVVTAMLLVWNDCLRMSIIILLTIGLSRARIGLTARIIIRRKKGTDSILRHWTKIC